MNDNDIFAIIIGILEAGFVAMSLPSVVVAQNYQPTPQGIENAPTIYIHKLSAGRYGYPGQKSVYNAGDDDFDTTDSIWRLPSFQISGLSVQDPSNISMLTASDIVETAADILQFPSTRQTLSSSDIGIFRIKNVREVYFSDDRDRYEQEPSFDFELSYLKTFTSKTPRVTAQRAEISRV